MTFRSYDALRLFTVVARHLSFTAAAQELNLTKGAVSYQISQLEKDLGFSVFRRLHRGVALTEDGQNLLQAAQPAFAGLEREIRRLGQRRPERITIGMSTYFASRWLSPRLMTFITQHPEFSLNLMPLIDLIDLQAHNIDLAIRWGKGDWTDLEIEPLLPCPVFPAAGTAIAGRVARDGLAETLAEVPLLHDRKGSVAWRDWFGAAGLAYPSAPEQLVIPDPNVRVQAVIDGQGVALYDESVAAEIAAGQLIQISPVSLDDYGYFLAYPKDALSLPGPRAFRAWILAEAGATAETSGA